ncbi:hypothetical protein PF005_g23157 [Phytophthora fragariae]|uniref:Secreted protein n=1 Tax=Phytophthora fragariae TaxID=53985 RepID=A0A6A3DV76_9STRA|nr:hypothetical protein PF003_g33499 [Phytophthora fragariae]KAE8925549.1 hypothetical protein PF009_g24244 [Phytophthora fragariae]KAE8981783.1 hypothetical protein PF011_g21894 [Phytophthora fragariae]KAE9078810.1 hypothetical protein PF010_g22993 [Phytophthora fragariae]KAE9080554.1 hypothetical protein PF007_g23003 [Phytophthora fragariae]
MRRVGSLAASSALACCVACCVIEGRWLHPPRRVAASEVVRYLRVQRRLDAPGVVQAQGNSYVMSSFELD